MSGSSYVSTVRADGSEFYQPTTNAGDNGYRVTGMYIGDKDDHADIQRVIIISVPKPSQQTQHTQKA